MGWLRNNYMFNITNIPEVKVYKISDALAIIDVQYNTRYELCSAFMRMQEHYESDINCIKGQYFTLEKYMDEYAKKNGGFSYTMDWSGFNIPSKSFFDFYIKFMNDLLEKEKILIDSIISRLYTADQLSNLIKSDNPSTVIEFYIIGSYKECPRQASVIQHEIAHALYSMDEDYAYHSDVTCAVIPYRDDIIKVLKEWGYADAVINDEVQAYVRTNCKGDWEHFPTVDTKNPDFAGLLKSLQLVFNKTCTKYGIEVPKIPPVKITTQLEKEYKKRYGYNAGEMI